MIIIKVLLISSGTKKDGSTMRAVYEAKSEFLRLGICDEFFWLGNDAIFPCSGCGACKRDGICIHKDKATELSRLLFEYDGFIFFTPVHYGGARGNMISTLSRIFMSKKSALEYKPAASISVSRRGGNVSAVEEITRFFGFASMPSISGNYPGIIHGTSFDEASMDKEGLQTIRSICDNMAWILHAIKFAEKSGIYHPTPEEKIKTSYIEPIL